MPATTPRTPLRGLCVVLPTWGAGYIGQCLDMCLPSLLAPGNLPAAATALPTTFFLLTRTRDMALIYGHPAWQAIAAICDARLQSIDDLVSEASSCVLTLAYARVIRSLGVAALDTGFVFLVSDYVVADGSLRHIVDRLLRGVDAVLAGNFQITKEAEASVRAAASAPGGVALSVPPRTLVRLALAFPHPTTLACMPDGLGPHDAQANRAFWRAGPGTLAGRFYLLHMVAIRPITLDAIIAAPCDYSFVPEFCPEGRVEIVKDSDHYLVVEMQPVTAGLRDWQPGPLSPAAMSASAARWVTRWHRGQAAAQIIYHDDDLHSDPVAARQRADRFIAETDRLLAGVAHPHRHHPYWAGILDHHRATAMHPVDNAALATILGPEGLPKAAGAMRRLFLGRMPLPRPWHPHWADLRVLLAQLGRLACGGRRLLIVSREPGHVRAYFLQAATAAGAKAVTHLDPETAMEQAGLPGRPCFDAAFLIQNPAKGDRAHALLAAVALMIADGAPVIFAMSDLSDQQTHALAPVDVEAVARQKNTGLMTRCIDIVPAPHWRIASQARMMARARAVGRANERAARFGHIAAAIAYASLSLGANLACQSSRAWREGRACSTAVVHMVRAAEPASTCRHPHLTEWAPQPG